jgi:hypothetical protein
MTYYQNNACQLSGLRQIQQYYLPLIWLSLVFDHNDFVISLYPIESMSAYTSAAALQVLQYRIDPMLVVMGITLLGYKFIVVCLDSVGHLNLNFSTQYVCLLKGIN